MKLSDRHMAKKNKTPPSQRGSSEGMFLRRKHPDLFLIWERSAPESRKAYMDEIDSVIGHDRIADMIVSGRIDAATMFLLTMFGYAKRCGFDRVSCNGEIVDILETFPRPDFIESWPALENK